MRLTFCAADLEYAVKLKGEYSTLSVLEYSSLCVSFIHPSLNRSCTPCTQTPLHSRVLAASRSYAMADLDNKNAEHWIEQVLGKSCLPICLRPGELWAEFQSKCKKQSKIYRSRPRQRIRRKRNLQFQRRLQYRRIK